MATLTYLAVGNVLLRDSRLRYQLTLVIETAAGPLRGSSVIEATVKRSTPFWGDTGVHFRIEGEAPAVELPDGRWVFALLSDTMNVSLPELAAGEAQALPALSDRMLRGTNGASTFWPALKAARPEIRIDAAMMGGKHAQFYPDLVVVDPADIGTIRAINPIASERLLGSGTRIVGLELRIVDTTPIITLDRRAPWVLKISHEFGRVASSTTRLHHGLRPSSFVARN